MALSMDAVADLWMKTAMAYGAADRVECPCGREVLALSADLRPELNVLLDCACGRQYVAARTRKGVKLRKVE